MTRVRKNGTVLDPCEKGLPTTSPIVPYTITAFGLSVLLSCLFCVKKVKYSTKCCSPRSRAAVSCSCSMQWSATASNDAYCDFNALESHGFTRFARKSSVRAVRDAYSKYRFCRRFCIWAYANFHLFLEKASTLSWAILRFTVDSSERKTSVAFHTVGLLWLTMHSNLLFHASEYYPLCTRHLAHTFMPNVS